MRRLLSICLLACALCGLRTVGPVLAASTASSAPPVAPVVVATPDPMAAQLQAALIRQAAITDTKNVLAAELLTADQQKKNLLQAILTKIQDAEQKYMDAKARVADDQAKEADALQREAGDKALLVAWMRTSY